MSVWTYIHIKCPFEPTYTSVSFYNYTLDFQSVMCIDTWFAVSVKSTSYLVVIQELEKPPPDPLHGLRIHSWVLVLEGKREVPESFFIEPFTGIAHPLTSENYLGIESLWNHQNYWVNMQDCSNGVKVQYIYIGLA